jgi:hypothetical protein
VLEGYIDASEEQPGIPVASVAAFVATEAHWEKFKRLWKLFLQRNEIKGRFQASTFWARREQFNWDDDKHNRVKNEVCQIFNECGMIGYAASINCNAFEEWRLKQAIYHHHDPYYFCLQRILRPLIFGLKETAKDEGIAIYIDRDNARQKIGESVAEWAENRLRCMKNTRVDPQREISTHYVSSFDYVPLQAADILANSAYKNLASYLKTKSWTTAPFMDCLDKSRVFIGMEPFADVEMIEILLKGTYVVGEEV